MLQCKWSVTSYTLFCFARVMVAGKENGNVEWAPNSPTAAAAVSSHARIIAESIQSDRTRKKQNKKESEKDRINKGCRAEQNYPISSLSLSLL